LKDAILRKLFLGFIQVHILYHAQKSPIYGVLLMDELKTHGYDLSPGTLYPILHNLESCGLLKQELSVVHGKQRKNYVITEQGVLALQEAKLRVTEMFYELNGES